MNERKEWNGRLCSVRQWYRAYLSYVADERLSTFKA